MTTANELLPVAEELEEIPCVRDFEVLVRLKKSSKYYPQGLEDPTDPKSKPRFFKLSYFTSMSHIGTALSRDAYVLHFNSNAYRIEDVELFLVDPKDAKNFVRIV